MSWGDIPDNVKSIARTLLVAVREKDPYTYGHCRRVARNARLLAKAAGLNEFEQRMVEYASLFHDLGKMGIPDQILLKPAPLTPEEEQIMRQHPIKSVEIIEPLSENPFFKSIIPGIRHHHERIDGLGYPDGISKDQIPMSARIILIADTFDAMTTSRPYRKGLPFEVAYKELQLFSNRQFDPHFVKIFLESHKKWEAFEDDITEEFVTSKFSRKKKAA